MSFSTQEASSSRRRGRIGPQQDKNVIVQNSILEFTSSDASQKTMVNVDQP